MVLEYIIGATVAVSLISLVGILTLGLSEKVQKIFLMASVAFSAGTLLGGAFFDLFPESLGKMSVRGAMLAAFAGIISFFVIEKFISWHHHHGTHGKKGKKQEKPFGWLNLVGDGLHNFFDGIAIAASFLTSVPLGITTTIVIALHEIPQEFGDYGLLIHSGFSSRRAIAFNLLTALTAILGGLFFFFAAPLVNNLQGIGLAFTAGSFIYIATSDLFPEFHRERHAKKSLWQLVLILAGAALIWVIVTSMEG